MRLITITLMFFLSLNFASAQSTSSNGVMNEFDEEFAKADKEVYDPLSDYNRAMTSFNDAVYVNILEPVANGYATVVPETARKGVSNFFDNLLFPIRFINNVLQLKFDNALEELGRFTLNSTLGLAGLIDVASIGTDWEEHNEDFGQTLGHYGVPSGPHIVLPFMGPSNLRDFVGLSVDFYADPTFSLENNWKIPNNLEKSIGLKTLYMVNKTSLNLGAYENLKKDAIDLYPFLRDIYEQKREKEIEE